MARRSDCKYVQLAGGPAEGEQVIGIVPEDRIYLGVREQPSVVGNWRA